MRSQEEIDYEQKQVANDVKEGMRDTFIDSALNTRYADSQAMAIFIKDECSEAFEDWYKWWIGQQYDDRKRGNHD